jgi:chromosome segregation ATPase
MEELIIRDGGIALVVLWIVIRMERQSRKDKNDRQSDKDDRQNDFAAMLTQTVGIFAQALEATLAPVQALQERIGTLETERETDRKQRIADGHKIELLQDNMQASQEKCEEAIKLMADEIKTLRDQLSQANTRIEALTKEASDLRGQLAGARKQIESLQAEGERKDQLIQELTDRVAVLETQLADREQQIVILRQERDRLQAQLEAQRPGETASDTTVTGDSNGN